MNGYFTQDIFNTRLIFYIYVSENSTPQPPTAVDQPFPPPTFSPPPQPDVASPAGLVAKVELAQNDHRSVKVKLYANTGDSNLKSYNATLRLDPEFLDISKTNWTRDYMSWTWSAHTAKFKNFTAGITDNNYFTVTAFEPEMRMNNDDVVLYPFGNMVPLIKLQVKVRLEKLYYKTLVENYSLGTMTNSRSESLSAPIRFMNNLIVHEKGGQILREEFVTQPPPPPPPKLPYPPPEPIVSSQPPPIPQSCGGDYFIRDEQTIAIQYPGLGETYYPPNADCVWRILPQGQVLGSYGLVSIQVTKLDIEPRWRGGEPGSGISNSTGERLFIVARDESNYENRREYFLPETLEKLAGPWFSSQSQTSDDTFEVYFAPQSGSDDDEILIHFTSNNFLEGTGFRMLLTKKPIGSSPRPPPPPPSPPPLRSPPNPAPGAPLSWGANTDFPQCDSCQLRAEGLYGIMTANIWQGKSLTAYNNWCVSEISKGAIQKEITTTYVDICYFVADGYNFLNIFLVASARISTCRLRRRRRVRLGSTFVRRSVLIAR